ncbi:hypothetical protein BaRGS_00020056 [Batillaria attramentaria]|uniref:Secreted protein n=1 Tax=Batillaria attramentaria TaxID=370345 RepID=A0ABD0KNK3_9CAEN
MNAAQKRALCGGCWSLLCWRIFLPCLQKLGYSAAEVFRKERCMIQECVRPKTLSVAVTLTLTFLADRPSIAGLTRTGVHDILLCAVINRRLTTL